VADRTDMIAGTLLVLAVGAAIGVVKIMYTPGRVGDVPRDNELTRWPEEPRGRMSPYTGASLGAGVQLSIGSSELDEHYGCGNDNRWARMAHRHRYPKRSGEVLEALMAGPGLVCPPIPWKERAWLYMPPASEM